MAYLGNTFDPNEIPADERGEYTPIPAGDYLLQIVESDIDDKGDRTGLKLTYEVVDGEFSNRKIFDYLNIVHPNATAQQISQRALADLCLATGVGAVSDTEELHFRPFIGKVAVEKRKDNGEMTNKMKKSRAAGSAPPAGKPAASPGHTPAHAAAPKAAGSRPWGARG
jgi:hypothetical protein